MKNFNSLLTTDSLLNSMGEDGELEEMRLKAFLAQIRVVLVNTTLPANIGSTARAMYTMGLSDLVVVAPKLPIDEDAIAHAAGANELLANARIVDNLDNAIADCHWVFATSSRQRHIPKPVLTPQQAVNLCLQYNETTSHTPDHTLDTALKTAPTTPPKIALLFGREDRGLTNDELSLADYHIQIPANPAYSVLNVAAAVQVIASVFYASAEAYFCTDNQALTQDKPTIALTLRQTWDAPPITHAQQQQLGAQWLALLASVDLYQSSQPSAMPQRINRLLGRLQLDHKEYQLLQAFMAKIRAKL